MGDDYRIAAKVGVWPLLQFARAAEAGMSMTDYRGLAAVHAMLQDVIHEDDWGRFQENMIVKKASDLEALMQAAQQALELLQASQGKNGRTAAPAIPGTVEDPSV